MKHIFSICITFIYHFEIHIIDFMANILIRLKGVPEDVLIALIKKGYYKTKSEAIRAGLLELGRQYDLIAVQKPETKPKSEMKNLGYYR